MFQDYLNEVLFCNFVIAWISSQLPEQKEGFFFQIRFNFFINRITEIFDANYDLLKINTYLFAYLLTCLLIYFCLLAYLHSFLLVYMFECLLLSLLFACVFACLPACLAAYLLLPSSVPVGNCSCN